MCLYVQNYMFKERKEEKKIMFVTIHFFRFPLLKLTKLYVCRKKDLKCPSIPIRHNNDDDNVVAVVVEVENCQKKRRKKKKTV